MEAVNNHRAPVLGSGRGSVKTKVMMSPPMLKPLLLSLASLVVVACSPWPQSNPRDPARCDPACAAGRTCLRGTCVAAADAGVDA